jgi:hypothetical protein
MVVVGVDAMIRRTQPSFTHRGVWGVSELLAEIEYRAK